MKIEKYILEIDINNGSVNRNINIDNIISNTIPSSIESSIPFSIYDTITINGITYRINEMTSPNYKIVGEVIEVVTKISIGDINSDIFGNDDVFDYEDDLLLF